MQILILIETTPAGRFCARAGEPFNASAEADSADEAKRQLEALLRQRLHNGIQLATIDLGNGLSEFVQAPLQLEPVPDEDWFFRTLREAIAENRQREDEAAP